MRDYRNSGRDNFRGRRDGGKPQMHDAVCAKCGEDCQVPFRPTGNKPVFCSNCFEKESGGNSRNDSRGRFDRRDDRRAPRRDDYGHGTPQVDLSALEEKLQKINEKVTVVIRMLEAQEAAQEKPAEKIAAKKKAAKKTTKKKPAAKKTTSKKVATKKKAAKKKE